MPDTHINAFYMDVQDKEELVKKAQGELEAAQVSLKAHPDYVAPTKMAQKPRQVTRRAGNGQFVDKDEAKKSPTTTVTEKVTVAYKKK